MILKSYWLLCAATRSRTPLTPLQHRRFLAEINRSPVKAGLACECRPAEVGIVKNRFVVGGLGGGVEEFIELVLDDLGDVAGGEVAGFSVSDGSKKGPVVSVVGEVCFVYRIL